MESLLVRSSSSSFNTVYEGLFTIDPFLITNNTSDTLENIGNNNTSITANTLPTGNLLHPESSKFPLEYTSEHYFQKYFLNNEHYSFVGVNADVGTFALSVVKERDAGKTFYRSLLWTKKGIHHYYFLRPLQATSQLLAVTSYISKELFQSDKNVLGNVHPVPKQYHSDFWAELLKLEQMFIPDKACIGVVDGTFAQGAVDLDHMITSAVASTAQVTTFFDKLGAGVKILDMDPALAKFAGLLGVADANPEATAYTSKIHGVDIAFHVSSLLPMDDGKGGQQVARKRLIGNDVGAIVILSEGAIFDPNAAASKVNHVFLIMQLVGINKNGHITLRVATTTKAGVPSFGPKLADEDNAISWTDFRGFVLTKLLNGMNAATQHAPGFKREEVYLQLLEDLHVRFTERARTESVFRDLMNNEPSEDAVYDFDMYNSSLDLSSAGLSSTSSQPSSGSATPGTPGKSLSRSNSREKYLRKSASGKLDKTPISSITPSAKAEEENKSMRKSFSVDKVKPAKEPGSAASDSAASTPPKSPSFSSGVSFASENEIIQNDDDDEDFRMPTMLDEYPDTEDSSREREVSFASGFDVLTYDVEDYDTPESVLGDLNSKLGDLNEEQKAYILSMVDLESDVRANEILEEDYGEMWTTLEHTTYVDLPGSANGQGYTFIQNDDHILVTSVIPGGVADKCGLCNNDKILSVNNVKIHTNNIATVASMLEDQENPFDFLVSRAVTIDGAEQAIQDSNPAATLLKAWINDKKDSISTEEICVGKNLLFETASAPAPSRNRSGSVAGMLFKSSSSPAYGVPTQASSTSSTSSPSSPSLPSSPSSPSPFSSSSSASSLSVPASSATNSPTSLAPPNASGSGDKIVLGGSINALIHHLTVANDAQFTEVFMMTYASFTTNEILMKKLIQKYYEPQSSLTTGSRSNFLVCSVLKKLISDHWDDLSGKEFLILREFLVQIVSKKGSNNKAEKAVMNLLIESVKNVDRPKMLPSDFYEDGGDKSSVLDFSAKDIARQLTLRDSIALRRIRVSELLGSAWSRDDRNITCPNLMALIKQFNEVSHWCSATILSNPTAAGRSEVITKYIKILKHLFTLNNFSSMIAIIAGLNSAGVCRLKDSFALVSKRIMSSLVDLTTLMSSKGSYHKYREYLQKLKGPCIPYMGLYLQDLTFIEDGNPNKLPNTSLINFTKRKMVYEVVEKIRNFQIACQYKGIKPNTKILSNITGYKRMTEDEMYKLSLVLEPKKSNKVASD